MDCKSILSLAAFASCGAAFAVSAPRVETGAVFGEAVQVAGIDSYAMALDREGDRLYVGSGSRLSVLDVSAPLAPRTLGEVEGMDRPRQVAARDGFAYMVSRETGMRIVDCTDPAHPRIRSRFDSVEFATGIEVVGKVAFLSERINGVEFVDVSDPDNPAHIAIRKTGESQSSRYRDGYLYSGEWGMGAVTVFDAHDMASVRKVGTLSLHGFGDGLEVAGDCLYCSTGHDAKNRPEWKGEEARGRGRGMDIFSLADPAHPKHLGRVDFPRFLPRNEDFWTVRVSGGVAYCADSHNGLFAVDVKDPAHPKVLDRFCVPQADKPDWPSAAISSLAVGEGCLYVTASPGGLYVIPVKGLRAEAHPKGTPPAHPEYREPYPTDAQAFHVYRPARPGQARTAVVRGDLVCAAFGDAGLHVLRIREDGFEKVGELPGRKAYDCCFCGDRLIVAEGLDGFAVYRLEGPADFREEQRRPQLAANQSVAFWCWAPDDATAVLTGRCGARAFYPAADLNRERPLLKIGGNCQWDKYLADRALGGWVPELVPYRGVQWAHREGDRWKLAVPATPLLPGKPRAAGQTCGICTFGDGFLMSLSNAYSADGETETAPSLAYVDRNRNLVDRVTLAADDSGVPRSDGRWVALNNRSCRQVALYDFADRSAPKFKRRWKLSGHPDLCAFYRGRVLIPAGHQGLLLEKAP